MYINQIPWVLQFILFSPHSWQHSLVFSQWHCKKVCLIVWFSRILIKVSLVPNHIQNKNTLIALYFVELIWNTFEKKSTDIFSLAGMFFGQKLHDDGPSCFSKQCNFMRVSEVISSHGLPSTSYWQTSPSQGATLCSFPKSCTRDLSIKLVFHVAPLQKPTQSCQRILSELWLFT